MLLARLSVGVLAACDDSSAGTAPDEHDHDHADDHGDAQTASGSGGKSSSAGGAGGSRDEGGSGGKGEGAAGAAGHAAASAAGSGGAPKAGASAADGGKSGGGSGGASGAGGRAGAAAGGGGATAPSGDSMAVTIHFKAKVGADDFACGREYDGQGKMSTKVTPRDLRLFVQDVSLIRADGSAAPLQLEVRAPWQSETVALLDFEDATGQCADGDAALNTELTGSVAKGEYTGLRFVNGVPEALNHADPATLPDPLKTYASLSWSWLTGFRFVKIEVAQVAAAGDSFGDGLIHVGSSGCTGVPKDGTVTCTKPNRNQITLNNFDASADTVIIDVSPIFSQTDLTQMSECHSSGNECDPMFNALGVDFASGKPKDGQKVFRVE